MNGKKLTTRTKHICSKEKIDELTTVYRLTIDNCSTSDEGEYKVVAKNKTGESEATAKLKICGR